MAGHRWLSIGDSTGYVEPFTGEGMSWALADAEAALPLVKGALDRGWSESVARNWSISMRKTHLRNQRRCRWLASQLRRPYRAEWMLRACNAFPIIRHTLVRKVVS